MLLRVFSLLLIFLFHLMTADDYHQSAEYLNNLSTPLPLDGTQLNTSRPLAPFITYRIKITSPYNLRPVYSELSDSYKSYFLIEGRLQRAVLLDTESDGFVGSVEFIYRGTGRPISIGLSQDRHNLVDSAQLEIYIESWGQRIWREYLNQVWQKYGNLILFILIAFVAGAILLTIYTRVRRRIKADEEKAEAARRTFLLESHNKRIEVMREIDKRAHHRADEIITKNFEELQKKIVYWRTRAFTESYFLNVDLRYQFAVANRDRIINELEKKWSSECLEIAQDQPLVKALREHEPGVMHWIQARQEVVHLAHKLAWKDYKVIEATFEEVPATDVIIADEFEEQENVSDIKSKQKSR